MGYVYKITNLVTNKVYVGKTIRGIEERLNEHISKGRKISGASQISKSLREYGSFQHKIEVLEECADASTLLKKEQYWIDKLNTRYIGYNIKNEYKEFEEPTYWCDEKTAVDNLSKGVVWNQGISPPKETRDKISKTKKLKHKLGVYENSFGHKQTEETKRKLSEIAKLRPAMSEETKSKLRAHSINRKCYYNPELKKRIFLSKSDEVPNGYIEGKGTCWVKIAGVTKSIDIWDLQKYLNDGYIKGR